MNQQIKAFAEHVEDTRTANQTLKYPACIIARLLYVGRYYSTFLPGAKGSITRERKRYERLWPGVNEEAFRLLATERTAYQKTNATQPKMNTPINSLLGPLEAATRQGSWEDVEDIAGEISRLARLQRRCWEMNSVSWHH